MASSSLPSEMTTEQLCMRELAKDVGGSLRIVDAEEEYCRREDCRTLQTVHDLELSVQTHLACDTKLGQLLDGRFRVPALVTTFVDGDGTRRGLHTGRFQWWSAAAVGVGSLSGLTNVGTHRAPAFDPACQECWDPGRMEGRFSIEILRARDPALRGWLLEGVYRLKFPANERGGEGHVVGVLEGLLLQRCVWNPPQCMDFTAFPAGTSFPTNPFILSGNRYEVHDQLGNLPPNPAVTTLGNFVGLDCGGSVIVTLSAPSSGAVVTVVHAAAPVQVTGFDPAGMMTGTAAAAAQNIAYPLPIAGPNIATLEVAAPANETRLLSLCTQ
jgi:hypothetical protein